MSFPLHQFESYLPKDICRKGHEYFEEDAVDNLTQDGDMWEADVYGSDEYVVQITMDGNSVEGWECDCPYDYGPVCKHVAAVLYAIRQDMPLIVPVKKKEGTKATQLDVNVPTKSAKAKSTGDPLYEIISKMPESEMRLALQFLAGRQNDVRAYLLAKYSGYLDVTSQMHYRDLVAAIVRTYKGRDGFIEYHDANRMGGQLIKLVEETDLTSPFPCLYTCEAVIVQLTKAIQHADDSSGIMGDALMLAFDKLNALAKAPNTPAPVLQHLFDFAFKESQDKKHQGWDWPEDLIELAGSAIQHAEQVAQLFQALDKSIDDAGKEEYGEYRAERLELLKMKLIEKWRSPAEAEVYLNARLHYSGFREQALEKALKEKRYADALKLAEEGIRKNKKTGLVERWQEWLIKISEATGDTATKATTLEEMYLERGNMNYYRQLKTLLSPADFEIKIAQFIRHFQARTKDFDRNSAFFNSKTAEIYETENRLDDLLAEISKSPSLYLLERYYALLAKRYPAAYLELYDKAVRKEMDQVSNRDGYQACCEVLKSMVKLGGTEQVRQIMEDWRRQYPRRKAMAEELAKVKL